MQHRAMAWYAMITVSTVGGLPTSSASGQLDTADVVQAVRDAGWTPRALAVAGVSPSEFASTIATLASDEDDVSAFLAASAALSNAVQAVTTAAERVKQSPGDAGVIADFDHAVADEGAARSSLAGARALLLQAIQADLGQPLTSQIELVRERMIAGSPAEYALIDPSAVSCGDTTLFRFAKRYPTAQSRPEWLDVTTGSCLDQLASLPEVSIASSRLASSEAAFTALLAIE